jgi:hypothetical protein
MTDSDSDVPSMPPSMALIRPPLTESRLEPIENDARAVLVAIAWVLMVN